MPAPKLDDLPPLARARALELERPYRPGHKLRTILIGLVLVSTVAVAFLLLMPDSAPRKRFEPPAAPAASAAPTDGVVYQNLRAPSQPLPARVPNEEPAP